jgi:hypothetical protein
MFSFISNFPIKNFALGKCDKRIISFFYFFIMFVMARMRFLWKKKIRKVARKIGKFGRNCDYGIFVKNMRNSTWSDPEPTRSRTQANPGPNRSLEPMQSLPGADPLTNRSRPGAYLPTRSLSGVDPEPTRSLAETHPESTRSRPGAEP